MNAYQIAFFVAVSLVPVVLDRGRILRDTIILVMVLALHMWIGFVALVLSPIAMTWMTIVAPIARGLHMVDAAWSPVTSTMDFVLSNTLPGQRKKGPRHDA